MTHPKRLTATLLALSLAAPAFGHGGGLDGNGCHTETATGLYHCHQNSYSGLSEEDKEDLATLGYVLLGIGIFSALLSGASEQTTSFRATPALTGDEDEVEGFGVQFEYQF